QLPAWPWYLAVQDGMLPDDVAPELESVAGIFLGGTTAFKRSALVWAQLAQAHRKRFHYGRAGTLAKVEAAKTAMADSLDSAFPLWTRERFDTFVSSVLYGAPMRPSDPEPLFPIHHGERVESAEAALRRCARRAGRETTVTSAVAGDRNDVGKERAD